MPGQTQQLSKRIYGPGLMTQVSIRFYPGQELQLDLDCRLVRLGGVYVPIITPAFPRQVIDGDDDYFEEYVNMEVQRHEEVLIIAKNNVVVPSGGDPNDYAYDYHFFATMIDTPKQGRGWY